MTPPEDRAPVYQQDTARVTEHLFRDEAGKLVATLTRMFGMGRLQLAEDVVQEALIRAMQTWPYYGIPENPAAWITQTAKNRALDILRREQNFRKKEAGIVAFQEAGPLGQPGPPDVVFDSEIGDDRLRMIFACCHPAIPREAQVALTLKTLCGLSTAEIAAAFLASEAAIAKRLTRARKAIRDARIPFEIPHGEALAPRLESVEQSLYLLFNEGYKASSGEYLVREELCREAIRLVELLTEHPAGDQPRSHALAALMCLNAARFNERLGAEGQLLRLQEQDRSQWDRTLIARGMYHLGKAASGRELSAYHIQAGIAACHCTAADFEATNWPQILALYDAWVARDRSPIVALNRAVALAHVEGPAAGKAAMDAIARKKPLEGYYLYDAVLGDLEEQLGHHEAAALHFGRAAERTAIESERAFLLKRQDGCHKAATLVGLE